MTPLAASNPLSHVVDHAILMWGDVFLVSNHMVMVAIAATILLVVLPAATRKYRDGDVILTGRGANFLEAMMLFVRDEVAKPVLGEHTTKHIGFIWTLFFFILTCNLLGLLPLEPLTVAPAAALGLGHGVYGTATANIAITAVLAAFAFVYWNVMGMRAHGVGAWFKHFLGGAPAYMAPIMIPVEIGGMIVKPAALAIRLFANMTGGHILVAALIGLSATAYAALGTTGTVLLGIPIILGTTAIMVLELFIAFLQAYIFTFLTCLFLSQMIVHHDDHAHDDHAHEEHDHEGHDYDPSHTRDLQTEGLSTEAVVAGSRMAG